MNKTILHALMEEDRHVFVGGGAERKIICPFHDDRSPSMCVNVVKDVYKCHVCHASGNAYQYLIDYRKLDKAAAMKELKHHGARDENIDSYELKAQENKRKKSEDKIYDTKVIYNKVREHFGSTTYLQRTSLYTYTDKDGKVIFHVGRYELPREGKKPKKHFRPFTLKADGSGFWVCGPLNPLLPLHDKLYDKYPLYNLQKLEDIAYADKQVWLVEGEKCADIVSRCETPNGHTTLATCIYAGTKKDLNDHDLSPLYRRRVLILADADLAGHTWAKKLGAELHDKGAEVKYFLPPYDTEGIYEKGYDVGDAGAREGWTGIRQFIKNSGGTKRHDEVFTITNEPATPDKKPASKSMDTGIGPPLSDTQFFVIHGYDGGGKYIIFQTKKSGLLYRYGIKELNSSSILFSLAPKAFWDSVCGTSKLGNHVKDILVDNFHVAACAKGEINAKGLMVWGRGAHKDSNGQIIYNIGSSILKEGMNGLMSEKSDIFSSGKIENIYQAGPAIEMKDDPHYQIYANELYEAILRYRWEKPEHGEAFMAWIVTSIIGGALPFRPMVWLTAEAESGKSYLMKDVLKRVLGSLITDIVNGTEAGIASLAGNNSLPFYLDEFEPEKGKEQQQNNILSLIRMATSGDAERVRGSPGGDSTITRPRFSLLMSSISRPSLSDADNSRIVAIQLSQKKVDDWISVKREIERTAQDAKKCKAIITGIIRSTKKIVDHAAFIEEEFIKSGMSTRDAQIMGALSAGKAFFTGDLTSRLVIKTNKKILSKKYALILMILSAPVHISSFKKDVTLGEALKRGYFDSEDYIQKDNSYETDYQEASKNVGVKGIPQSGSLLFAKNWSRTKDLIKGRVYENVDIDEYLLGLPGAHTGADSAGRIARRRFGAGLRSPYTVIPFTTLVDMGFFDETSLSKDPYGPAYQKEAAPQTEVLFPDGNDDEIPF